MLGAVISYFTTRAEIHEANDFNFGPVKEVGYLFIGIFLTMSPAWKLLEHGGVAGFSSLLSYDFTGGIQNVLSMQRSELLGPLK